MRLHRVVVENFRCLQHREVSLLDSDASPRPLTVLVGPNMSGKTTLLDAIHLAYEGVSNARRPRWRPDLDPDDPTLRPDPNRPIEVRLDFSLHAGELAAIADLEATLGGSLDVEESSLYSLTYRWPVPASSALGVVAATPHRAQYALRGRALAAMALDRKLVDERRLQDVGGVFYFDQARRGKLTHLARRQNLHSALHDRATPRDVIGWLVRAALIDQRWGEQHGTESQWRMVKRLFANLGAPAAIDDMESSDAGYDLRLRRDGAHYRSAGMSSGERQILRLVAGLAFDRAFRSVVLIDEIELNLHPRWQRSLLRFCQTGGDDDNQFIVSTHSEALLRYVDPDAVIKLGDLDDT